MFRDGLECSGMFHVAGFIESPILAALRVPTMWGIRVFCRFCPEECGALGDSF